MRRRDMMGGLGAAAAGAALAAPRIGRAQEARVLRFVPQADVAVLDPVWTTAYQTRDHGFLVFDTLFGQDAEFAAQPQMVDGVAAEDGGRRWTLRLRDGLRFHDGEPVLARDCAASVRRWGARDSFGQALMAATDELSVPDDRTIVFRLSRPFPLLPDALGKTSPSMCPIMPERLASTDPSRQVSEMVGSGPYRFKADERVPGARLVYERFDGYRPREGGTPGRTAGPKVARFDRIEWVLIPDSATAAAALQRGEVDWWFAANADLLPRLRADRRLVVRTGDPTGIVATMRFNQLHPPFNNPGVRRALLHAVDQAEYMTAVSGPDRALWGDGVGYFCPGTPLASDAGMEVLRGPRSLDTAKRALDQAGYRGERVALMMPTDIPSVAALAEVTADLYRKLGLNLDGQTMDWATAIQRRANQEPVERGGWSVFQTSWSGTDHINPAGHVFLRGNGRAAAPGWPDAPRIEALRDEWLQAPDPAAQRRLAEQLQLQAFQDVPYIPLGQQFQQTAFRADLQGILRGCRYSGTWCGGEPDRMVPLRVVLDTSVVRAGFVSARGASRLLLVKVFEGEVAAAASTALMLQYEDVLARPATLSTAGASVDVAINFVDDLCAACVPIRIHVVWRPQSPDAGDDLVIDAAVNGLADVIATYDERHLRGPAARFGIAVERPADVLRRIL